MHRFILLLLALAFTQKCPAESKIFGSWKSDKKATIAYLKKHAVLNDYQKRFFEHFFGHSIMTFNPDGTGSIKIQAHIIPMKDGSDIKVSESEMKFTFKLLGESKSQLVVEMISGKFLIDEYPFSLFKFQGADSFSVSLADSITDINGREFFKRLKR